jgi:hypothetical protein
LTIKIPEGEYMDSYSNIKCWEIMNCNNRDCSAICEPETPCWEIAKRVEDYRNVSNTCKDCIVYILQEKISILHNIIRQRKLLKNIGAGRRVCVLEATATC